MPLEYRKNQAFFRDVVGVEAAENLIEWLQKHPSAKADLSDCLHLHPANIQVLLAGKTKIAAWPRDAGLKMWLESILPQNTKEKTK